MSQTEPVHSDSLNVQDPDHEVQKKPKSRRPASKTTHSFDRPHYNEEADSSVVMFRYCFSAATIESLAVGPAVQMM